jgi:hypothetical protein
MLLLPLLLLLLLLLCCRHNGRALGYKPWWRGFNESWLPTDFMLLPLLLPLLLLLLLLQAQRARPWLRALVAWLQ